MDIMTWIQSNLALTIIGAVTVIQISPIKIDPWSWVMKQIRTGLGIEELKKEIDEIKKDAQDDRVDTWRWNILDFGNSCRNERRHSREEWGHVIDQVRKYERYCEKSQIENGVIEEESKYLRALYQERLEKNDFL